MKKITIILTVVTSLLMSSCDSMLEEVNYGNATIEEMMSNPDNAVMLVGQAYADLKWLHDHWGYWGVVCLTGDEASNPRRVPGPHWEDGGYWNSMNTHTWKPKNDALKNIWNTTISGAVGCNKIIDILSDYKNTIGEDKYNLYACELETLRSYYYYLLFDCFGRISYLEKFEEVTEPLMEQEQVWAKLVNTLEKASKILPEITDGNRAQYYGRVTKGFTQALLARLYLNAESFECTVDGVNKYLDDEYKISDVDDFYTKAANKCFDIMNSGAYSIEDNFFSNFKIFNESSRENIFVLVEDGTVKDEMSSGSMSSKLRILSLTAHYSMQVTWGLMEKPWNGFCARPEFIKRYAATDVRGPGNEGKGTNNTKQWGWFIGPVYDADGVQAKDENGLLVNITNTITSLNEATWNDGARLLKYEYDKTGTYKWGENDFVLFRYADVLWMYEEAVIKGAVGYSTLKDSDDFKMMLARAFAYDDNTMEGRLEAYYRAYPHMADGFTEQEILDERGRELAWELVRRRDLIRCGKFNDPTYVQYVTAKDDYRKWFPIPDSVLEKALRDENGNSIWTQNEGYL